MGFLFLLQKSSGIFIVQHSNPWNNTMFSQISAYSFLNVFPKGCDKIWVSTVGRNVSCLESVTCPVLLEDVRFNFSCRFLSLGSWYLNKQLGSTILTDLSHVFLKFELGVSVTFIWICLASNILLESGLWVIILMSILIYVQALLCFFPHLSCWYCYTLFSFSFSV